MSDLNADNVLAILYYYWVLSDDYYPIKRDRLGYIIMDIFYSSTTARGGTVVELSGYYGTNEALEYGDIELYALRDSEYPSGVKLGAKIQLRLLKDQQNCRNL